MDNQLSEFVVNAQNGDKKAFARLYELTLQSTYYFAIRMLENEQSAMDVVRDSFIEAFSSISRLKSPDVFEGYVKHIVAGKCRNYLKDNRGIDFDDELESDGEYDEGEFLPAGIVSQKGAGRFISAVMDSLDCRLRMVALLFYYNKLSISAIAKFLGCAPDTVEACIAQIKNSVVQAVTSSTGIEIGECEEQDELVLTQLLMRAAKVQKINEELYTGAYKDIYEQMPQFLPDASEQSERKSSVNDDDDDDDYDDDDYEEKSGLSPAAQVIIVVAVLVVLVAAVWVYFFLTEDVTLSSLFSASIDVPGKISDIAGSIIS